MNAMTALFYTTFILSLVFIARFFLAVFSGGGIKNLKKQWLLNTGLFIAFVLFCLMFLPLFAYYYFPPTWWDRRVQRQQVFERLQPVGGWDALKKDCISLTEQYKDEPFVWFGWDTSALPDAIAALKPQRVEYYSPKVLRDFSGERQLPIVQIAIFGAHSTGGRDIPTLQLEVMCGQAGEVYQPPTRPRFTTPLTYWRCRKVTDDIYELY